MMKCLVAVKHVVDFTVKVQVKKDGTGIETDNVKMSMNPFDEIALEEAVRHKEKGIISEIVVVTIGSNKSMDTLRMGLARGADRAIFVETPSPHQTPLEPINIAKILKAICIKENIEVALLGKQAIDDDCNQTAQMLAGLLHWGQATNASKVNFDLPKKLVEVTREIDGGLETLALMLPSVISVDLRLNEPRYVSLPNIMKAKSKPFTTLSLQELNVELRNHLKVVKIEAPKMERKCQMVETVEALVNKLKEEEKVI